ncbi:MAG TPA: SpoIIE family protein phosphatase [Bradyrhizobium sp.]|nr:SpoIIE family protein phosphatase [Bradyrhizobium sp.]
MSSSPELDFLLDDGTPEAEARQAAKAPWRVLIVDDDESVHSISRVVLADVRFQGRDVEILSAYSARQAAAMLRQTHDVAVVLLDVVMEDDDAGLRLVREIREELRNTQLRIILRTGQPGQAPEREVIVNYDINDYKSKTELTAQKLFTATIAALRSYSDIVALERSRRGLEQIIAATPELFARHTLASFVTTLLGQVADLTGQAGDGVVVIADDEAGEDIDPAMLVVAASGRFVPARGRPYHEGLPDPVAPQIRLALTNRLPFTGEADFVRPIRTPDDRIAAIYFRAASALDTDRLVLVDIMCALVGVGLDNVKLHTRLLRHQAGLEAEVEARTRELATINADLLLTQNQINEELRVARTLQQSILPTGFPPHDGYQGHAFMRAARMIGGDFYDIFRLDDHRLGIVVADVSGKGVPAALFMVLVRTVLQDLALRDLAPGACLAEANRQLIARNPLSLFVAVIYGILDARSGLFTFCSGGHVMPYVLRADGVVEVITARGAPLVGLIEDAVYLDLTVSLQRGDGLLLVTDGVAECFNRAGEAFGEKRLLALLASAGSIALDRLLAGLVVELDRFSEGLPASDDVTALAVRFAG